MGTGTFPRERGWGVRAPAWIYSVFQDSMWYHSLSCGWGTRVWCCWGSSVPTLANMHHCPVPLSQGPRGAPAYIWSYWVILSAPELPDARAPQHGLSSTEDLLMHRKILMAWQMLKWAHLKLSFASTCCKLTPLSQLCKGPAEGKQLKCHDFKPQPLWESPGGVHGGLSHICAHFPGVCSVKIRGSLRKGFWFKWELSPVLPAELDSSGKHSRSHPGAGLPQPQPSSSSSSSSSSAGPGCPAGQAAHTPTGRTGLFRASAWNRVFIASHRWRVHN